MDQLVLIVESARDFEEPLRTLAIVDIEKRDRFHYFPNRICWSTEGGYWGEEWASRMKILKRVE